jgi:hypothetical protein
MYTILDVANHHIPILDKQKKKILQNFLVLEVEPQHETLKFDWQTIHKL